MKNTSGFTPLEKAHLVKNGFLTGPTQTVKEQSSLTGFTLIEVLITTAVLVVAILSTLGLFSYSLSLTEEDRDLTIAQHEAERWMEEISGMDYVTLRTTYTNNGALRQTPFTISGLTGKGVVYAEELPGAVNMLMRIKVVVCYRQKNRIIGEDTDFDGILDGNEDTDGNGELDSPCEIEKVMVNREF